MLHCLVVDDSNVIRWVHRRMLNRLGFRVSEAADGKEALALCGEDMPDAVLVDWQMPVMDGLTFLKEIRKLSGHKQPKVLLCSNEASVDRISEALTEGADEYVMKPFDLGVLASKLSCAGLPVSIPTQTFPSADFN